MNKTLIFVIIAIVLVVVVGGIYLADSKKTLPQNLGITGGAVSNGNSQDKIPKSSNVPGEQTIPTKSKTQTIAILNFEFSPSTLMINKGGTVVWTNKDSARHTVVSSSGSELNSNSLSKGQTYMHKFENTGEFTYHCSIHPSMQGRILVK